MPTVVGSLCNIFPPVGETSVEKASPQDSDYEPEKWLHPRGGIGPPSWDPGLLFSGPGRGMDNKGNICFMNAVIQALVHCPPFAQGMLLGLHSRHCTYHGVKKECGMCAFEEYVRQCYNSSTEPLNLDSLVTGDNASDVLDLINGDQQCALEGLRRLFQWLRQFDMSSNDFQSFRQNLLPASTRCTTFLGQLFTGVWEEAKKCEECGVESKRQDTFDDIIMSVRQHKQLEQALGEFFSSEYFDGDNKIHCDSCHRKTNKVGSRRIIRLPAVLTLMLHRVRWSLDDSRLRKDKCRIEYPTTLDVAQYLKPLEEPVSTLYDLTAIVCHQGDEEQGHYWAYCVSPQNLMFKFDDKRVCAATTQSEWSEAGDKAFMLFYVRRHQSFDHPDAISPPNIPSVSHTEIQWSPRIDDTQDPSTPPVSQQRLKICPSALIRSSLCDNSFNDSTILVRNGACSKVREASVTSDVGSNTPLQNTEKDLELSVASEHSVMDIEPHQADTSVLEKSDETPGEEGATGGARLQNTQSNTQSNPRRGRKQAIGEIPVRRLRGRPRKNPVPEPSPPGPKRGRGRPRKYPLPGEDDRHSVTSLSIRRKRGRTWRSESAPTQEKLPSGNSEKSESLPRKRGRPRIYPVTVKPPPGAPKRGRGRPRKDPSQGKLDGTVLGVNIVKRSRGRPRKSEPEPSAVAAETDEETKKQKRGRQHAESQSFVSPASASLFMTVDSTMPRWKRIGLSMASLSRRSPRLSLASELSETESEAPSNSGNLMAIPQALRYGRGPAASLQVRPEPSIGQTVSLIGPTLSPIDTDDSSFHPSRLASEATTETNVTTTNSTHNENDDLKGSETESEASALVGEVMGFGSANENMHRVDKRGQGRPRKSPRAIQARLSEAPIKRGPGRPRKSQSTSLPPSSPSSSLEPLTIVEKRYRGRPRRNSATLTAKENPVRILASNTDDDAKEKDDSVLPRSRPAARQRARAPTSEGRRRGRPPKAAAQSKT